ncbi:MAG TPA: hypothetical protein DCL77_00845 [Prolixibacteraceae bacterium]|jgi:hypothetical protein|nr:hypothetical protein [Prolixibacteraceae bacterium]
MKYLFIISAFIFISLLTSSCSKEKSDQKDRSNQIDTQQLFDCNKSQNYDSTKLASKLIGTWRWTTSYAEMGGTTKADKAVFLNFTQTGTYTVTENSVVISLGNWDFKS